MKYLTIDEICEALGVSRPKLKKMEAAGEIPKPIFVGKSKRWDSEELNQFLKERRKQKESV